MPDWQAPAKLNLSLLVGPADASGYHSIQSLAQTIEVVDLIEVDTAEEDTLEIDGFEVPVGRENLVWRAADALRGEGAPPRLGVRLSKRIPVAAGLGGGSADAAATLSAVGEIMRIGSDRIHQAAAEVGADVRFLLTGGTGVMTGRGDRIEHATELKGFAVAVAVPPFELSTAEVYRRWDELGGPQDGGIGAGGLPPVLRPEAPLRNDLTASARALRPELADWSVELARHWGRPVAMTGSGPALFGYFADLEEAEAAAAALPMPARWVAGAALRPEGVARVAR